MDSQILLQEASEGKDLVSLQDLLIDHKAKREIGEQALWSVSTAKVGYGVDNLRDNRTDTYWQSDGSHPHSVTIHLNRCEKISDLAIYVAYDTDESYTPKKLTIKSGHHAQYLKESFDVEWDNPKGWQIISFSENLQLDCQYIEARVVQILVTSNHLSGRDSHIRQVKIFGPRSPIIPSVGRLELSPNDFHTFASFR